MSLKIDLTGKKGLIIGIRNEQSIAYGCARIFRSAGAELAVTYRNEKVGCDVTPLAQKLLSPLIMSCDVQNETEIAGLFSALAERWGFLDFLLHSVAFAPKADLQGRVVDCSKEGFLKAMDISCYSFIRMAKYVEPLMKNGGSLLTVSYIGAEHVVKNYGLMGPVKAALESATRYLAAELGEKNIRVNVLSPSAIKTAAASGIANFDDILQATALKAPMHRCIDLNDIGHMAAFLVSDLARNITGGVHRVDAGYEAMD